MCDPEICILRRAGLQLCKWQFQKLCPRNGAHYDIGTNSNRFFAEFNAIPKETKVSREFINRFYAQLDQLDEVVNNLRRLGKLVQPGLGELFKRLHSTRYLPNDIVEFYKLNHVHW